MLTIINLINMNDQQLFRSSSVLNQQFDYVNKLSVEKEPIETETVSKIQDFQYDENDEISLAKPEEITGKEAFKEPQYINDMAFSKTQNLTKFLPKIIRKYEQEEKENSIKRIQKQQKMTQNEQKTSQTICYESNINKELSFVSNDCRKKKIKKDQYPTKNLLQSFRTPFLKYLGTFFPAHHFEKIPIIKRIRQKQSINMQDYEDLFKEEAFKPHLRRYFHNKVIYRDLFQSRIEYKYKRIYFRKLYVFERAFNTGKFRGIN